MFFMPESPYRLLTKGRENAAIKSLKWLRGKNYDISDELVSIKDNIEQERKIEAISWKSLFTVDIYWKPFAIVMVIMTLQQFSGINAVTFYQQIIFIDAGTSMDPCMQISFDT